MQAKCKLNLWTIFLLLWSIQLATAQIADTGDYLQDIKIELKKQWPDNKRIHIVFHGHSVPSGYFKTPKVNLLAAYPQLVYREIAHHYPYAVINVITTAIGGENSLGGMERFEKEVLNHRPDVLFIDYGLNDRGIGIEASEKAWRNMIEKSLSLGIKIILLTPTPDWSESILTPQALLAKYSEMIRKLATEYKIGLVDSYALFKEKVQQGNDLKDYMSQANHLNEKGHVLVAKSIMEWFLENMK